MNNNERMMDSTIFVKLFKYMKLGGIRPLRRFVDDIQDLRFLDQSEYIKERVFLDEDRLGLLISENKEAIMFLRNFKNNFLRHHHVNDEEFYNFLCNTAWSMDNIDLYIGNAEELEKRGVSSIMLGKPYSNGMWIYYDNLEELKVEEISDKSLGLVHYATPKYVAIIKPYSDGIIEYLINETQFMGNGEKDNPYILKHGSDAQVKVNNPKWIICVENSNTGSTYRYAYLYSKNPFDFDASELPSKEELDSMDEPETFKKEKKEMVLSLKLPF